MALFVRKFYISIIKILCRHFFWGGGGRWTRGVVR